MIGTMSFDYQNPDTKKRRKCSKCGAFLGPAATYCSRCGTTASGGGKKFGKWLIIIILIVVVAGYFRASDVDPVDWVVQKANDLLESTESTPDEPPPATAKPQVQKPTPTPAKPQTRPEIAKPQGDVLKLTVGRAYHTQRGYVASLKKEWLLEFKKHDRDGNKEAQKKMRDERQVGNLKAGLTVELLELNDRENWAKVRIQGKKTIFYTAAEALVE